MKIGIVCHPSIGGSGLVASQLGLGLAKLGHDVHFISRTMPFKLVGQEENISFHMVEPITYPLFQDNLYTFALTAMIIEVAEKYSIDIMHAHYSIPHSLCANLASRISRHRFCTVTTIHGTDTKVVGQNKPLYPLNRYSIMKSDCVTTVSEYQKEHTLEHFHLNTNIEVIHNFIDLDVFSPEFASSQVREQLATPDEKIIMHISNFRQPKNTVGVIRAFARTVGKIRARLVLVGDGPDLEQVKNLCHDLKLEDRVTFMGKRQHIEKIIANADCIFQPSYAESFGMVALEAMACCIPVVSSDLDGIPEVVVHGETGYLGHPDDYDTMADYLVRICSDDVLQKTMGQQGRQRAQECFSDHRQIEKYLSCYQKTLTNANFVNWS
jgi:N-acetyl-alpha-D-glucosaminyl L-malate synthase BshA